MTVGFTIFARQGDVEFRLRNHGHKDRPALVTQAAIPGVRIALMGRLYYRADLRAGLDVAAPESGGPLKTAMQRWLLPSTVSAGSKASSASKAILPW